MEAAEQLDRADEAVPGRRDDLPDPAARRRVAIELYRNHRNLLLASARRVSLCSDDAEDAMQRGLEILLTKAPTAEARRLLPWARTVIRNEALAIRKARERTLGRPGSTAGGQDRSPDEPDWVGAIPSGRRAPEEEVEGREEVARSREALALLKPQELKALTQLAAGMSYAEIQAANGWTRTKVNRCLAEGREKLRSVVRESEAGERCRSIEPLISAAADRELEPEAARTVRNHLAVCGGCRAMLREYRRIPAAVVGVGPVLASSDPLTGDSGGAGLFGRFFERLDELSLQAWFRINGLFGGGESASAAVLGPGGARGLGTNAIAKAAAICVGTAGGAAACFGTGLVPVPGERGADPEPVAIERPAAAGARPEVVLTPNETSDPSGPEVGGQGDEGAGGGGGQSGPPPDPVVAEFSPGQSAPVANGSPPVVAQSAAPPPPPAPSQARQVPLGGSGEFGP